ncbi:tRNA dihydrouridine synthase [Sphaerotilus uruguayifluvii]|uniref:tRNA-dihydrouridine(16) synthase n=1 Tax=Sphaerotilus uruguayifluvii TaxID=2735897 RepID=A0ABX2G8B2_9BURK|nr:tRNA-dihydrouridine synthase [Leptothrix sp. C29]NRT58571.1 tRNA-dihydrouridine synthase C [Leptothrix sp. C29]
MSAPRLLLAPMEGLLDFVLRDMLTRAGAIERCVSEFIRVTDTLLPERVFHRIVPELRDGARTPAGVPVRAQLLGSDPACLADNAARLAGLGPAGIDLNFGCPAKVVNRHGGGAALLDQPELMWRIVSAVRRAVPASMPVSAKMRLGVDDDAQALDAARAAAEGGACEIVVHARTKAQGYRPPAYWDRLAGLREALPGLPIVANGEIWSLDDARRCLRESGCDALMLGRGIVADPGLAIAIASAGRHGLDWPAVLELLADFWLLVGRHFEPGYRAGRLKQWLQFLRQRHPQAGEAYLRLRTVTDSREIARGLFGVHRAAELLDQATRAAQPAPRSPLGAADSMSGIGAGAYAAS